jgi:hypothetical protein
MATDHAAVLEQLTGVIGDLRPLRGAAPTELQQAQLAVAHAVSADQSETIARATSIGRALDPAAISAEHRAGLASAAAAASARPRRACIVRTLR